MVVVVVVCVWGGGSVSYSAFLPGGAAGFWRTVDREGLLADDNMTMLLVVMVPVMTAVANRQSTRHNQRMHAHLNSLAPSSTSTGFGILCSDMGGLGRPGRPSFSIVCGNEGASGWVQAPDARGKVLLDACGDICLWVLV